MPCSTTRIPTVLYWHWYIKLDAFFFKCVSKAEVSSTSETLAVDRLSQPHFIELLSVIELRQLQDICTESEI
eukprot:COSAG03_NODE_8251_length_820_cov_1.242718_1_plen_71_part_10